MLQYVSLVQSQPLESTNGTVICSPILYHVIGGVQKVYAATQVHRHTRTSTAVCVLADLCSKI